MADKKIPGAKVWTPGETAQQVNEPSQPLACRFCPTFVVSATWKAASGLVFRRTLPEMLDALRAHVAGCHRAEAAAIKRALNAPRPTAHFYERRRRPFAPD